MNHFRNAYEAACAISELSEFVGNRDIGLAISNMCSVIGNEINEVPFELVRNHSDLRARLKIVSDQCFYVAAAAHAVAREEEKHLLEERQVQRQLGHLFRCVTDIQSDLNDEPRYDWDESQHWSVAANAPRKLHLLREEQGELA